MIERPITVYIISGIPGRANYLKRALKSALAQNYGNYNVVVRMGYRNSAVEEMADERVTFSFFVGSQIGIGKKLGRNLAESVQFLNDFVCFMDDDDYFASNKLRKINEEFGEDFVFIHNGIHAVDYNGEELNYQNERDDFNMSSISVRKEIIDKTLFYDLDSSMDTAIYLSAVKHGKMKFIKDKLTYYTIHSSTTIGFFGSIEEWRKRKLHSYADIIQPTYLYLCRYFQGTPAEDYAKRLVNLNKLFIRLYSKRENSPKISFKCVIKGIFQKQYLNYRDTFASKVILASYFSRNWTLRKLYKLDSELVVQKTKREDNNDAAGIYKWD